MIAWNGYTQEQKRVIDRRLSGFLSQCVSNKLQVTDVKLLAWQLDVQQIRHNPDHDEYCWVFALMKAGAGQIDDPAAFGFVVDRRFQEVPISELKDMIDREFYVLSEAHYERYIQAPDLFGKVGSQG